MTFIDKLLKYASNSPGSLSLATSNEYTPVYIADRPVMVSELNELLPDTATEIERERNGN